MTTLQTRVLVLVAIAQLAVFLCWLLSDLLLVHDAFQLSRTAAWTLAVCHAIFCWIAVHFIVLGHETWRTLLETSAVLLLLPLPIYVLLYLMGGLDGAHIVAVHLMIAAILGSALVLSKAISGLVEFSSGHKAVVVLARFLPALLIWTYRDTWITWLGAA